MSKKDDTTSFVIRFTQKMYQDEANETQVQWRGNIKHVQGGEEQRFSDFSKAVEFIQGKLAELTIQSAEHKPVEEQKGILSKSFDLWKKMAADTPRMVMNTIKDPKGQVELLQNQVKDVIGPHIEQEVDQWRSASKSDFKQLIEAVNGIAAELQTIKTKVDKLSEKEG